ncbi:MAG: hypothetical protein V4582_03680 [Pseudomonadota bacterium]
MSLPELSPFFQRYIALWSSVCLLAVAILAWERKRLLPEWRDYVRYLCVPWKLWIFAPAFLFVTFAGRYTDDETWDVVSGAGMSILTYLTAPWSIGLLYQTLSGSRPWRYLLVAIALILFSSSWFYDGYLLWRDGAYTVRWWANLTLSTIIYFAAGILWNLEAGEPRDELGRRAYQLGFLREDWPAPPRDQRFWPLALATLPFILVGAFLLVACVGWSLSGFAS